jgi:hypothetical protein
LTDEYIHEVSKLSKILAKIPSELVVSAVEAGGATTVKMAGTVLSSADLRAVTFWVWRAGWRSHNPDIATVTRVDY